MLENNLIKLEKKLNDVNLKTFNYDELLVFINDEFNEVNIIEVFLKYYDINERDNNQDTLLHFACRYQFIDLVQYLIDHHVNVNDKDKCGSTPLTYAIDKYFNVEIVELLLKSKSIDIGNNNSDKICVLQLAIEKQNVAVIKLIIKYCYSKIIKINDILFHEIICNKSSEIVTLILPYVENINAVNSSGNSALHLACERKNEEIAIALVQNSIDINLTNRENFTALNLALSLQLNDTLIMSLLNHGADCNLNSDDKTTLQYAIEYSDRAIVVLIINNIYADNINNVNWKGESALHTAVKTRNPDFIDLLLQNRINVNLASHRRKVTAIHLAFYLKLDQTIISAMLRRGFNCNLCSDYNSTLNYAIEYNNIALIKLCLNGLDKRNINYVNSHGESALHTAIKMKNECIIELLLTYNIDVNLANGERFTALHLALDLKLSEKIIKSLLEHGADCNLNSVYDTNINYAIKYNNTPIFHNILSKTDNSNINNVNWDGESALHAAIKIENESIVLSLLRKNINVNLTNRHQNLTALHLALSHKLSKRIIIRLFEKGADCNLSSTQNTTLNYAIEYNDNEIIKLCLSKLDAKHMNEVNVKGEAAIHTAIYMKNEEIINLLLENNVNVKSINSKKETVLHLAFDRKVSERVIHLLLNYGVDYDTPSAHNTTLNYAVEYGEPAIVELILFKRGTHNINDVNVNGESALHTAIKIKNEDIINLLLQYNIDVNLTTKNDNFTALRLAFSNKLNEQIIFALLEHGANCNLNFNDDTILHDAVRYRNLDVLQKIINKLETNNINDMNSDGESALHTAIRMKDEGIINVLLENNINVNLPDGKAITPLQLALILKLNEQIIRTLIKHGANCNLASAQDTTMNYAMKYDNNDVIELIIDQIDKNHINDVNGKRESALHVAVKMKNEVIIKFLLRKNIDVNLANNEKLTALHLALTHKLDEHIIVALLEHGADCHLYSSADTTLNYAIKYDNINVVKLILDKLDKNNINDVNWDRVSALHIAVTMQNEEIINLLLQNNINVNLANGGQFTALHLALSHAVSEHVILELLNRGADCNLPSKYEPTLHYAIRYNNINIIKLILAKLNQSSINSVNLNDESALHIAVSLGNINIINLILNQNIDLNIVNMRRLTALQEACISYHYCSIEDCTADSVTDIIELILSYHAFNRKYGDNVLEALYKLIQIETLDDDVYFNVLHLLLFDGHVKFDVQLLQYLQHMAKEEIQLVFLSLLKHGQLAIDSCTNTFYFVDANNKRTPIKFNNCNSNQLVSIYNEIQKMTTVEISATHKFTYFQLLCMDKNQIASAFRSEEVCFELKKYQKIATEFPEYFQLISTKCTTGRITKIQNIIFTKCFIRSLPANGTIIELDDAFQYVINKLSKYDILNFIESCRVVPTSN